MNYQDKEYEVPLQDQRFFGAGIKRKRVQFVPSSSSLKSDSASATPQKPAASAADLYLSIVLPKTQESKQVGHQIDTHPKEGGTGLEEPARCEVCNLPLPPDDSTTGTFSPRSQARHETSLAHQVCLAHSHPPSHLDRNRSGLKYLTSYGWDPDSRKGLGAKGEGVLAPIKTKVKSDTVGLGLVLPQGVPKKQADQAIKRLDAKGTRKAEEDGRRRREKLQELFYRNEDLEKYLGPGA